MVTVIIPTYNGAHKVINALRALEIQTYKNFETIVIVDGSTDNTVETITEKRFNLHLLRVVTQENKGRASVRNKGAREASGEILIFFDDDMRPVENCVFEHVTHHRLHKGTILAGSILEEPAKMETDIQRYKANIGEKWLRKLPARKAELIFDSLFLSAANFSISKNLYQKLGGFDERLKDAEDILFALKANQQGISIFFDKAVLAWHDDFVSCKSYIKRLKEYKVARDSAASLSDDYRKYLSKLFPVESRSNWKRRGKRLLCTERIIELIDNESFILQFIPTWLRYNIYSIVIWESSHE